jgi:hypothetical protein
MNIADKKALDRLYPLILLGDVNKIDVQFLALAVISFCSARVCFISIIFAVFINLDNLYYDLFITLRLGQIPL